MTMTGQLELGVVQVNSSTSGALIGYAFTEALERGQLQRWILYTDPANAFEIGPAPASMAGWTLADWQKNLASLWKPGSVYVWAQADVYEHGGVYGGVTWTKIPDADSLPHARFPAVPGEDFQLDPPTRQTVLELASAGAQPTGIALAAATAQPTGLAPASATAQPTGLAYTVDGVHDARNREYWMLPSGAQPAGGSRRAAVREGAARAPTLQSFVDLANQRWAPGSVFVIIGCGNYRGATAPVLADSGAKAR
jgi:hypothetical protein